MNDEVSVAALLEREGWDEPYRKPSGRMRTTAVMLAVVLGCGLAALLVHFGSKNSEADSPSLFNQPHPPTGGLAGGGVPSLPTGSEVTASTTTVVVTNQAPGAVAAGVYEIPRQPRPREDPSQTVTTTDSANPGAGRADPSASSPSPTGAQPPNSQPNSPARPSPSCVLLILLCQH